MPKISVIVPVYNVEQYLPKCLDSIINQTFKDIGIICINDGSMDNSGKVLEEYAQKDDRVKILNQKNQGQAVARNRGLDIAKGKYIYFLDSDDFMQRKGSTTNELPLLPRKTATYEILEEIFANPNMSTLAKDKLESLSDLLMRSLPITDLEKFPKEAEALTSLAHFKNMYNQTKAFSHPTFLQRLFSVSQHFSKPIKKIRFLGLSFKSKQKKG